MQKKMHTPTVCAVCINVWDELLAVFVVRIIHLLDRAFDVISRRIVRMWKGPANLLLYNEDACEFHYVSLWLVCYVKRYCLRTCGLPDRVRNSNQKNKQWSCRLKWNIQILNIFKLLWKRVSDLCCCWEIVGEFVEEIWDLLMPLPASKRLLNAHYAEASRYVSNVEQNHPPHTELSA